MTKEEVKILIDNLEMEINNGGFDQFYFNSAGDYASATVEALKAIEAIHTSKIVQSSIDKFPNGLVPKDRNKRQNILIKISPDSELFESQDEEFYEYQDDLANLLKIYTKTGY